MSTEEIYVINKLNFHLRVGERHSSYSTVYEILGDIDKIEVSKNSSNFSDIKLSGYGLSDLTERVLNAFNQIFIDNFDNKRRTAINSCTNNK